jgi:adenine C2-methylase RlmN of 23S rRNA A2503 and tRNA A37
LWPAGINDEKEHAEELADLLRTCGGGYHVNLIPYNPIEGSEYKRPYRKVVCFLNLSATPFERNFFPKRMLRFMLANCIGSSVC